MTMTAWLATYGAMTAAFFLIDMVWLGVIARPFYQAQIGHLTGEVNWVAAIVFYLVFLIGVCIFAVAPALDAEQLSRALLWGALFGFFTYATYDMTNLATLKDWPLLMAVVDIMWGTFLTAVVAGVGYSAASLFLS